MKRIEYKSLTIFQSIILSKIYLKIFLQFLIREMGMFARISSKFKHLCNHPHSVTDITTQRCSCIGSILRSRSERCLSNRHFGTNIDCSNGSRPQIDCSTVTLILWNFFSDKISPEWSIETRNQSVSQTNFVNGIPDVYK